MTTEEPTQPKLIVPGAEETEQLAPESPSEDTGYDIPPPPNADGVQLEQWRTCFVIAIDLNGVAHFAADPEAFLADKDFDHMAHPSEAWLACTQVAKDLSEISIAQRVLMNMQMLGQAMAQQAQNEEIMRQTNARGARGPFVPPNRRG